MSPLVKSLKWKSPSDRGAGPTLLTGNCGSEGAEGWGTGGREGLGEKDLLLPFSYLP